MKLANLFLSIAFMLSTPSVFSQSRFSYSNDASEVTDSLTGLVWRRCPVGMTWSGDTCSGTTNYLTLHQGLAFAKTQIGWRLPNIRELASIVDRTRLKPAIEVVAFPGTSSSCFLTSTPAVISNDLSYRALIIDFWEGNVTSMSTSVSCAVRLVR